MASVRRVTRFFVPGVSPGSDTLRAYDELRRYAEARTGSRVRTLRICALICRRDGRDGDTRVGEPDPCSGGTVHAIFAIRDGYAIVSSGGYERLSKRQVYDAIEFDGAMTSDA